MPRLDGIPEGCAFNPRCPEAFDRCRIERPDLLATPGEARAACWLYAEPRRQLAAATGEAAVHG
jgi:peptide/nickel transport system ATP-binding protein